MASFSLARVPFYIAAIIFCGLSALVAWWNNTISVGVMSDLYLVIMVASLLLCGASVLYMFTAKSGSDDEVDLEVGGLQFGKTYYYFGIIALAVYRLGTGYIENHSGTGMQSTWGVAWLIGSIGLLIFTWANYKSYASKQPIVTTSSTSPWKVNQ